jgi:hypothetical protein
MRRPPIKRFVGDPEKSGVNAKLFLDDVHSLIKAGLVTEDDENRISFEAGESI